MLVLGAQELIPVVEVLRGAFVFVLVRSLLRENILLLLFEIVSKVHDLRLTIGLINWRVELHNFFKIAVDSTVDYLGAENVPVLVGQLAADTADLVLLLTIFVLALCA